MKFRMEFSAGGIVYKKEGNEAKWLIVQLSSHKGWGFPKGHIGDNIKNETAKEAAVREVQEEGGINAKIVNEEPLKIQYMFRLKDFLIKKTVSYFLMAYESGDIKNHNWEVHNIRFTDENDVRKTLTQDNDRQAFEKALQFYSRLK